MNSLVNFFLWIGTVIAVCSAYADIDMSNFPSGDKGFKIFGAAANDLLAAFLAPAGDFNGDGLSDVLIVAEGMTSYSRTNCGTVLVVFGKLGSAPFSSIRASNFTASATNGFRVYGAATGDGIHSSRGLGDFNKDGLDDIAIGSGNADPLSRTNAGTVTVIFGRRTGIADIDLLTFTTSSTNGVQIIGAAASAQFGLVPVTGPGDYNADGFADLFASATGSGIKYMIFGKRTWTSDLDLASLAIGTAGFTVTGGNYALAVGDINNDGIADIGVSDVTATLLSRSQCGAVYIFFGHTNATSFTAITLSSFTTGTAGFKFIGAAAGNNLGTATTAGDFNNDGLQDIILGHDINAGSYIIFGRRGVTSYSDVDLSTYLSTANRGQRITNGGGGFAPVGYIGDINGDGISDVFVTSCDYNSKGALLVLLGHRNTTSFAALDFNTFTAGALGYRVFGALAGDNFGFSASSAGDMNGDGWTDILIGGRLADPFGQSSAGMAAVVFGVGPPTSAPTLQPSRFPTSQPSRQPSSQPSVRPSRQPSRQPTAIPSAQPSSVPTKQPASRPSSHPSAQPSTQPSSMPSRHDIRSIASSPTYKVRNGFAFAAIGVDGGVRTWGEAPYGGDSSAVQGSLQSNIRDLVAARFAYAAVTTSGAVSTWGVNASTTGLIRYRVVGYSLSSLVANEVAFAGVDSATGTVIAFGSKHHGGDVLDDKYCNGCSAQLSAGVRSITASATAFAAITAVGTAYAWGNLHGGGVVPAGLSASLVGVRAVVATREAFAARLVTGDVVAWGGTHCGGDTSAVNSRLHGIIHIVASKCVFVAFNADAGLVAWGRPELGGDTIAVSSALASGVKFVANTANAWAAIKTDGSVVTWGLPTFGGNSSTVQSALTNIVRVEANMKAFAALTSTGGVVVWGNSVYGGVVPVDKVSALTSGVLSLYHTDRAFAALKTGGSVVVWGQAGHGGSPSPAVEALLVSGVHTVCANDVAFSALKADGAVVAWGHVVAVPSEGLQFIAANLVTGAVCH